MVEDNICSDNKLKKKKLKKIKIIIKLYCEWYSVCVRTCDGWCDGATLVGYFVRPDNLDNFGWEHYTINQLKVDERIININNKKRVKKYKKKNKKIYRDLNPGPAVCGATMS